jgi:hypothetical protein
MKTFTKITFLAALGLMAQSAYAEITAEQAASLGGDEFTPIGAERAGNAAGTIPAWTGGLTELPAGYVEGEPLVDPFPDEQPLFTITAENFEQYRDNLSTGQIALLQRYPNTYRMPVYPTHRTAAYPETMYAAVKEDALTAKTTPDGNGLVNVDSYVPFPFPTSGVEVIWNHVLRYRGGSVKRSYTQIPVQANGSFSPVVFEDQLTFAQYLGTSPPNRLFYYKQSMSKNLAQRGYITPGNAAYAVRRMWLTMDQVTHRTGCVPLTTSICITVHRIATSGNCSARKSSTSPTTRSGWAVRISSTRTLCSPVT